MEALSYAHEYGYVVKAFAIVSRVNATIAGMMAENKQREIEGKSLAYDEVAFNREANKITNAIIDLKQQLGI